MAKWNWKKGMFGLQQPFTIKKPDGVVVDLTGFTVTLYVWSGATPLFNSVGVLDADPTTGICYFTMIAADFATAGKYRFEVECTKALVLIKTKNYIVENTEDRV